MKKTTLAIVCSSLLATSYAFADAETEVPQEPGGTTYFTGNIQSHSREDFNGSDVTSTIEAGHTFKTGTTILMEIDGIQLGNTNYGASGEQGSSAASAYTTLGLEQAFNLTEKLWVAAGFRASIQPY